MHDGVVNDENRPAEMELGLFQYLNMIQRNWNRGTPIKGDEKLTRWHEPLVSVEADRRLLLAQDGELRWFISREGWEWVSLMRARFPHLFDEYPDLRLRES